ncbi:MAG: lipopolysaccharide biosynthesis protein [Ardenticatenaceae bacterium]|nr:lipopolysaccharide biosynthesis protein [Ardenticatenaceae bacterium]MCB9443940.1 lipopolysaccharide biosynthesis protein [Ardenticatenaceae bacterium]
MNDRLPRLTLRANFSWAFVGSIVYAAAQWGMLVVLTKLGSPEMVGVFAIGLAVGTPIMAFATLKTRLVQATDAKQTYQFGHYLGLRLMTTAVAFVIIVGIVLVVDYEPAVAWVILVLGLQKAAESLSDVLYGLFQQRERMDMMAISRVIKGPLSLIALGLGVYLTGSLHYGVLGMTLVWLILLFAYDFVSCARLLRGDNWRETIKAVLPRWDLRPLAQLAWLALPLGIVVLLESLATNIPRYFIERQLGVYLLGIFAAMAYLKRAGQTFIIAWGLSAAPRLAQHYSNGDVRSFRRLLNRLVLMGVVLGAGGVVVASLWGRPLLTLLYNSEYAAYQTIFVILILAAGVDYVATFIDYGMTAARQFRQQMILFISLVAGETLICYLLIPRGALLGAATAVLSAAFIRLVGGWLIIRRAIAACPHPAEIVEPALV